MTIYLYVKQHSVTGLKYFGKTEKVDPYKYMGSGIYWRRHLKKHGNLIKTLEVWKFDDQEMCTDFALTFSKNNNIVESKEWANLQEENGLDGNTKGNGGGKKGRTRQGHSEETKVKLSIANKGNTHSEESKIKMSLAKKGKTCSAETKTKMSIAKKGRTHSAESKAKMSIAQKRRQQVNHALIFTL